MKVVIKEWLKQPKACVLLIGGSIFELIYTIINAQVLIMISEAMSDSIHMEKHLLMIIAVCIVQIILSSLYVRMESLAHHNSFTGFVDRYADKILDADVQMFTQYSAAHINSVGEFCARITKVGMSMKIFLMNIISMIVSLCAMYEIAGNLVIPVIVIYIIGAIGIKYLFAAFTKIDNEADRLKRIRNQEIENIVQGFMEVRSFNKVEWHRKNFHKLNLETNIQFNKRTGIDTKIAAFFETVDTAGLTAVLIYSAKKISEGVLDAAQGMTLVSFVFRLINPMSGMLSFIDELSQNLSMSEAYTEIVNYVNRVQDDGTIELSEFTDSFEMQNVSFSYDNSKDALQGINISIKKGQKIGICGTSGGGKSTIFKLLNRFYDPGSGFVTIDGFDIRNITLKSYRKIIGSVHQENYIFPGSIKDNIVYGTNSYTEEEFLTACKKANIYDFIMEQEEKFDTIVGPRGLKLSGGQKQRIALARLLLMDPEIILLDEATSSLDNESEYLIQDAINNLGDKTIISIAHRLTTIQDCDKIYVMGKKKIIEEGTHDELMKIDGEYARMVKISRKREMRG